MGNVAPHERDARASGYDRSALLRHYARLKNRAMNAERALIDAVKALHHDAMRKPGFARCCWTPRTRLRGH